MPLLCTLFSSLAYTSFLLPFPQPTPHSARIRLAVLLSPTFPCARRQNTVHSTHSNAHFALSAANKHNPVWIVPSASFCFPRKSTTCMRARLTTIPPVILIASKGSDFDTRQSLAAISGIVVSILQSRHSLLPSLHTALPLPDTFWNRTHSIRTHLAASH